MRWLYFQTSFHKMFQIIERNLYFLLKLSEKSFSIYFQLLKMLCWSSGNYNMKNFSFLFDISQICVNYFRTKFLNFLCTFFMKRNFPNYYQVLCMKFLIFVLVTWKEIILVLSHLFLRKSPKFVFKLWQKKWINFASTLLQGISQLFLW